MWRADKGQSFEQRFRESRKVDRQYAKRHWDWFFSVDPLKKLADNRAHRYEWPANPELQPVCPQNSGFLCRQKPAYCWPRGHHERRLGVCKIRWFWPRDPHPIIWAGRLCPLLKSHKISWIAINGWKMPEFSRPKEAIRSTFWRWKLLSTLK